MVPHQPWGVTAYTSPLNASVRWFITRCDSQRYSVAVEVSTG